MLNVCRSLSIHAQCYHAIYGGTRTRCAFFLTVVKENCVAITNRIPWNAKQQKLVCVWRKRDLRAPFIARVAPLVSDHMVSALITHGHQWPSPHSSTPLWHDILSPSSLQDLSLQLLASSVLQKLLLHLQSISDLWLPPACFARRGHLLTVCLTDMFGIGLITFTRLWALAAAPLQDRDFCERLKPRIGSRQMEKKKKNGCLRMARSLLPHMAKNDAITSSDTISYKELWWKEKLNLWGSILFSVS